MKLKSNSGAMTKSRVRLTVCLLLFLGCIYALSFGCLVGLGRVDTDWPGYTFQYLGGRYPNSRAEYILAGVYSPMYWLSRSMRIDIVYVETLGPIQREP